MWNSKKKKAAAGNLKASNEEEKSTNETREWRCDFRHVEKLHEAVFISFLICIWGDVSKSVEPQIYLSVRGDVSVPQRVSSLDPASVEKLNLTFNYWATVNSDLITPGASDLICKIVLNLQVFIIVFYRTIKINYVGYFSLFRIDCVVFVFLNISYRNATLQCKFFIDAP